VGQKKTKGLQKSGSAGSLVTRRGKNKCGLREGGKREFLGGFSRENRTEVSGGAEKKKRRLTCRLPRKEKSNGNHWEKEEVKS